MKLISLTSALAASLLTRAAPVESKTVEYTWTLRPRVASAEDPSLSPDCNLDRLMLLVNDEFPGPTLEADVGDTVRVTMVNEHPSSSLALHFHGLAMRGQPYADGTAGVTQCASGPMQTTAYEFVVSDGDGGTHYWHGHVSMERGDGFQGPIVVRDPGNDDERELEGTYDREEVVFLQDWYHLDGDARRAGLDSDPFVWMGDAQSFLINGGGVYAPCLDDDADDSCADDCSVENYIKTIEVEAGKTYRLRIISGAELVGVNFAIAGHRMTVVEVEGTVVEPFEVENLDVMPAQRYSVLVTADQEPGSYVATTAVRYRDAAPAGRINFEYKRAAPSSGGGGGAAVAASERGLTTTTTTGEERREDPRSPRPSHPAWDDVRPTVDLEGRLFSKTPGSFDDAAVLGADPASIRRVVIVGTQARDEARGLLRWTANNVTMTMPGEEPMVASAYDAAAADGASSWPDVDVPGAVVVPDGPPAPWNYTEPVQDSVGIHVGERGPSYIPLTEGETVEVVLQNARALDGAAEMHSWHLHGHRFYVVGSGFGTFDARSDPASYNLDNPVRRDTATVLPLGWTAIRFVANNPGAWAFHCTQTSHAVMGMGLNFVTSPDRLGPPPDGARDCLGDGLGPAGYDVGGGSASSSATRGGFGRDFLSVLVAACVWMSLFG